MNFKEKHRALKRILSSFIPVIMLGMLITGINRLDFAREFLADYMSANAFYIPRQPQQAVYDGNYILSQAFFGQEPSDTEEKILILPNKPESQQTSTLQAPNQPEAGILEQNLSAATPKNLYPILSCDLSSEDIFSLNNTTKKSPDTLALLLSDYDFEYKASSDEPLVLILHTHATECYSREGSTYYEEDSLTRTNDTSANMIAVGKVLSDTLNENGINTLHCTILHDKDSYSNSYSLSANTVKKYLKEYPSIKYVFDLHRDAVMYESGAKARPVTKVGQAEAAQIMLLSGTDAGGADFPHWEKNLSFALKLADKMSGEYPSLLRPIALRGASYNQQYTDGSLLIEIGTDGNTLSQAKYSAKLLGMSIAELIKGE